MELIKWDSIAHQIATNTDVQQLSEIRNKLTAYKELAKQTKQSLETQNKIAEYRLRVDRKLGEWSKGLDKNSSGRPKLNTSIVDTLGKRDYFKEIDIAPTEMYRKEAIASLPEETFEKHIAEKKADKKELTSASVLKLANMVKRETQNKEFPLQAMPGEKYRILLCDPPWRYGDQQHSTTEQNTVLETHYPTMTISELCEMPIKTICEENAVLFLWVTSPLLEECFDIIRAWGFKYKTSMVWDKIKHNVGNYVSVRHEFLLICTKGSCLPDVKKLYDSVVSIERTKHSKKPEYFRELIDKIYPYGKRIELFARTKNEGWDTYGNDPVLQGKT